MSGSIRRASGDDVPAITKLVDRAYEGYVPRVGGRPGPMEADYSERVREAEVHVVTDRNAVIAVLVLELHSDHVLVENVAVAPERQGEGLGRLLLDLAEARARHEGLPELRLYTHVAMTENLAIYRRLGYRETHRAEEEGFARVFMAKRLE